MPIQSPDLPVFFIKKKEEASTSFRTTVSLMCWPWRMPTPSLIPTSSIWCQEPEWSTSPNWMLKGIQHMRIKDGDKWKAAFWMNKAVQTSVMFLVSLTARNIQMMWTTFQRAHRRRSCSHYMDDILIFGARWMRTSYHCGTGPGHLTDIALPQAEECTFGQLMVEYLGLILLEGV